MGISEDRCVVNIHVTPRTVIMTEPVTSGGLVQLDRTACLALLAMRTRGLVVFTEAALPAVEPVAYLLDQEQVICAAPVGSRLTAGPLAVLGFHADDLDPVSGVGWSVLGIGLAVEIDDRRRLRALDRRHLDATRLDGTLLDGGRRIIAIPLQRLTGHRLTGFSLLSADTDA
jgi:uncharacterized protein